jgi:hypothetical protein
MEAFRKHIAADSKQFRKLIRDTEKATGLPITAELYKRPKQAPDPKLAPFYAWKSNIGCVINEEFSPETFGPELGVRVAEFLKKLIPLYEYLNQFKV